MATKTPRSPALERFLSYRLHLLNKLTDRHSAAVYAQEFALPIGEARCLDAIGNAQDHLLGAGVGRAAPVSVSELAGWANLNKAQASRAAQALVQRGLVLKAAHATDARSVGLTLTRQGRSLWGRIMALIEQRNSEIFGCLSSAEQQRLGAMLDRLISHARD